VVDITHDMTDDGFHEIQLSGKQLVFLFMATTFVSILIFLCGVLVGRGVRSERETADATVAARAITNPAPSSAAAPAPAGAASAQVQNAPVVPPTEPPSPPPDDELTYAKRLEGKGTPAEQLKPQTSAARDARADPVATEPVQAPKPAPVATTSKAAAEAPPVAQGGRPGNWVVQLVALRDRSAAAAIGQRLSAKGYPAFIVNPSASASSQVFKVQVGRYNDRSEADRVSKRLEKEEKFNPWISR